MKPTAQKLCSIRLVHRLMQVWGSECAEVGDKMTELSNKYPSKDYGDIVSNNIFYDDNNDAAAAAVAAADNNNNNNNNNNT